MVPVLTQAAAERMIAAGLAKSRELGCRMTIAVVDQAGELIALSRMDGSRPISVEFALRKAQSAAKFCRSTQAYVELLEKDAVLNKLIPGSGMLILPGGVPVLADGVVAGGIGVSGAHHSEDEEVAKAALATLESLT